MRRMSKIGLALVAAVAMASMLAFTWSDYRQVREFDHGGLDQFRDGCELDETGLLVDFRQARQEAETQRQRQLWWSAAKPTPTAKPLSGVELHFASELVRAWEHGCRTGKSDGEWAPKLEERMAKVQADIESIREAASNHAFTLDRLDGEIGMLYAIIVELQELIVGLAGSGR